EKQQAGQKLRLVETSRCPRRAGGDCGEGLEALALQALAQQLAIAAHGFGALALLARGRLLEVAAQLHLAENALALQLLFERAKGLIDVIVANLNLHRRSVLLS